MNNHVFRHIVVSFIWLLFLLVDLKVGVSQEVVEDSLSYINMRADTALHNDNGINVIDTLIGNVEMIQDSLYMTSDRAVILDQIDATAHGNVVIVHQDSVFIYADHLVYDGREKLAVLTGEVILVQSDKEIHTTELTYDIQSKIASFDNGGTLLDGSGRLISKVGTYNADTEEAIFRYNVNYSDSSRTMDTDSLRYQYSISRIDIIAPTTIVEDSSTIYAEEGWYYTNIDQAILQKNVQVYTDGKDITAQLLKYDGKNQEYTFLFDPLISDSTSTASGDTIIFRRKAELLELRSNARYQDEEQDISARVIVYNNKTGDYITEGNSTVSFEDQILEASTIYTDSLDRTVASGTRVTLIDTVENTAIICQQIIKDDASNITKAYNVQGQPVLQRIVGGDTLWLMADTLASINIEDSIQSHEYFLAFHNAKMINGDVSAISDSIAYSSRDSQFVLYFEPIIWSDSTQLSADSIYILLSNETINEVELMGNGLIVDMDTEGYFNQIGGTRITNSVKEESIDFSTSDGNAEMIYFARDDNAELVGIQSSKSSKMQFNFDQGDINKVRFFKNPESHLYEFDENIDPSQYRLSGFKWVIEKRPQLIMFARNMKGLRLTK